MNARCLLLVALVAGCDATDDSAGFHAEALTVGGGPIAPTDPIGIRFSKELEPDAPTGSIRVFDESLSSLPVASRIQGRHLWLKPKHPSGMWPRGEELSVRLMHPAPGLYLTSLAGHKPRRGLRASVKVAARSPKRPFALERCSLCHDPESGARVYRVGRTRPPVEFTFDAPVEESSLVAGLQLVSLSRRVRVEIVARRAPDDWRRVEVLPHDREGREIIVPGETYQFHLTRHLTSVGGRSLSGRQLLEFRALASDSTRARALWIEFSEPADLRAGSPAAEQFQDGVLRPEPVTEFALLDRRSEEVTALRSEAAGVLAPFGPRPARLQIRVPGRQLGLEPCLLRRLAFSTSRNIPPGTEITGFEISIAYAPVSGSGLTARFDANFAGRGAARRVGLPGNERSLVVGRDAHRPPGERSALIIPFGIPFTYAGDGRDLVIEIAHRGVRPPPDFDPTGPAAALFREGIVLEGTVPPAGADGDVPRHDFVVGSYESEHGRALRFVPNLALETQRFPSIVSKWYLVDADKPLEFFLGPRDLQIEDLAKEEVELTFQGGNPLLDERGFPRRDAEDRVQCRPIGRPDSWSLYPPANGARAVRVRIRILPRVALRVERGQVPEIAYVFLEYRERD